MDVFILKKANKINTVSVIPIKPKHNLHWTSGIITRFLRTAHPEFLGKEFAKAKLTLPS